MDTEVIYRVLYSTTSHGYAVSPDGVGAYWYDSMKQAVRQHGEMPLVIIKVADFEEMRAEAEWESYK